MTRQRGEVVLGIDLGATHCVVAVVQDGHPEVLPNDIGDRSTPSCVHVAEDAARDVGEAALRLAVSNPHGTVRNVKSILGRRYDDVRKSEHPLGAVEIGGSKSGDGVVIKLKPVMTAEEVTSMLLVHLKLAAEEHLCQGEIGKAVIAVPPYFNAAQRQAVVDAAYLAGLQVHSLVNETSAAALAYARDREQRKTVVVVDVGGGGSSIAVVRTQGGFVEVLAASGRRLPGGEDFDACMVNHFKEVIRSKGLEVASARGLEILRSQWEKAKCKLSRIPATKIATFLPDIDRDFRLDIPRALFEHKCRPLFQTIVDELLPTLGKAEVAVDQVDDVVLVGGSSRVPLLRAMVQDQLAGRPLCKAVSADEAVATGAALLAAECVRLEEVTPLALLAQGGGEETWVAANSCLPVSHPLPHSGPFIVRQGCLDGLGGAHDQSRSLVPIYETNSKAPADQPHTFEIDNSGRLRFLGGHENPMMLQLRGCLGTEALEQIKESVKTRLRCDEAEFQRIAIKNELEERCRAGLNERRQAANGDPDADLIRVLGEAGEGQLQWLTENPNAPSEELRSRQALLDRCWQHLHESRRRRAENEKREQAERELRKKLQDRCSANLKLQAAQDDPDAQLVSTLQRVSHEQLDWLKLHNAATLDELSDNLAALAQHWHNLQDSREQRREASKTEASRRVAEAARREAEAAKREDARREAEAAKRQAEAARREAEAANREDARREADAVKREAEAAKSEDARREAEAANREAEAAKREAEAAKSEDARREAEAAKREAARREAEAARREAEAARREAEAANQREEAQSAPRVAGWRAEAEAIKRKEHAEATPRVAGRREEAKAAYRHEEYAAPTQRGFGKASRHSYKKRSYHKRGSYRSRESEVHYWGPDGPKGVHAQGHQVHRSDSRETSRRRSRLRDFLESIISVFFGK